MTHSISSADISNLSPEIRTSCYIKKYIYRFHINTKFLILLILAESSKIFLINIVKSLMMPARLITLGLLKIIVL